MYNRRVREREHTHPPAEHMPRVVIFLAHNRVPKFCDDSVHANQEK
jgi:hypothetical protein